MGDSKSLTPESFTKFESSMQEFYQDIESALHKLVEANDIEILENVWRVTPEQFQQLPNGTELLSISGEKIIKGQDKIDEDIRDGYLAYGFSDDTKPNDITFRKDAEYMN